MEGLCHDPRPALPYRPVYIHLFPPYAMRLVAFWPLIFFDFRAALGCTLHNIQLREGYAENGFTKDFINLYIGVHY